MSSVPVQSQQSQTVAVSGGTVTVGPKQPWYMRVPSLKRLIFVSLFVFTMALGALIGGFAYIQHVVKPASEAGGEVFNPIQVFQPEESGRRVFRDKERINILVLGIDYNYTNDGILYTKGARSDTILVVSLNREAEFLNVVSIPRDTQVLISEEYGYEKINSAYSYGGVEQAKETISEFLGVPIHHHVILKVKGAKEIVDAIGGLPIDVEKDMDYDDNWGKLHIHLKKGPQVLNGEQAVGYARFRMDEEGDRGRIRRQQQVVRALGSKLKEPSMLPRIRELSRIVKENIDTDLKILEMADLANLYSHFDFSKMRGGAIVGDDAEANGISFIVPYAPENEKTVRRLLKDEHWYSKSDLRVQVMNGSKDSNAAVRLADDLTLEGFNVADTAEGDGQEHDKTQVILHRPAPRAKGILFAVLGNDIEWKEAFAEGEPPFDVTIIVGNDRARSDEWTPPPRQYPRYDRPRPSYHEPAPEPEFEPEPIEVEPEPVEAEPIEVEPSQPAPRPRAIEVVPPPASAEPEPVVVPQPPPEPVPAPVPEPIEVPLEAPPPPPANEISLPDTPPDS